MIYGWSLSQRTPLQQPRSSQSSGARATALHKTISEKVHEEREAYRAEAVVKNKPVYSKFGQGRLCYFIPGETPRARHRRRHATAIATIESVRQWCDHRGVEFRLAKSNHPEVSVNEAWKWDFRLPGKFAQWRPFVGKLSMKTKLVGGELHHVKVYDTEQLLIVLEWWANSSLTPASSSPSHSAPADSTAGP